MTSVWKTLRLRGDIAAQALRARHDSPVVAPEVSCTGDEKKETTRRGV